MKKLLASALLAGLLLGTTSPVFAEGVEGDGQQSITLSSSIVAKYEVTIPSNLNINLENPEMSINDGDIILDNLTAAGSISVVPAVTNLTLVGGTGLDNETLNTILVDDGGTQINSEGFSLTNDAKQQKISIKTDELSEKNKPGAYIGSIIFDISYNDAEPANEAVAE